MKILAIIAFVFLIMIILSLFAALFLSSEADDEWADED